MKFYIKSCVVYIDYLFVLMISFAAMLNAYNLLYLLLFSSLHELGHLVCLILLKGKARKINISFYGFGLMYDDTLSKVKESIVLLSGPAVNLICYLFLNDDINLLLFVLNMLPIYPLDLGRVLRIILPKISRCISLIFLLLLLALAVFMAVEYKVFSLFAVSVYLFVFSFNNR